MSRKNLGLGKSVRKKPRQNRSQMTFQDILQATSLLLEERDFEEISTNKIAKKAGVSIGSLYQYFGSKEAILDQLVEKMATRQFRVFNDRLEGIEVSSLDEFVERYVDEFADFFLKYGKLRSALIRNINRSMLPKILPLEDQICQTVQSKLETVKSGDYQISAYLFVHTVNGIFRRVLMSRERSPDVSSLCTHMKVMLKGYFSYCDDNQLSSSSESSLELESSSGRTSDSTSTGVSETSAGFSPVFST